MPRPVPICPILPRCSCYDPETRQPCQFRATHWLVDDEGDANPGGYVCQPHGEAILDEYRAKLGEIWTLEPIKRREE